MEIKITSSIEDLEGLIKEISNGSIEVEGRGYYNKSANVFGIMISVKDDPTKTFDIFLEAESSGPLLKTFNDSKSQ